jgi:hypothetical protein
LAEYPLLCEASSYESNDGHITEMLLQYASGYITKGVTLNDLKKLHFTYLEIFAIEHFDLKRYVPKHLNFPYLQVLSV